MNYEFIMNNDNHFYLSPIDKVVIKSQENKINQQLLDACKIGNFEKVKLLIEIHGADLHIAQVEKWLTFNPEGDGPLHIAAANGYNEIIQYLIKNKANINATNKRRVAPIHSAVFKGRIDTVVKLLDLGAEIEIREDEGDTPLCWSSYMGYAHIVEFLLHRGANIHNRNKLDYTPLHWACYIGHLSVVKILIEYGANIYAENKIGETPIDCASKYGRDDVYFYLISIANKSKVFRVIEGGKT